MWKILGEAKISPGGGSLAFSHFFSQELQQRDLLSERLDEVGTLLVNGVPLRKQTSHYKQLRECIRLNPNVRIIFRVDGPISIYRGSGKDFLLDQQLFEDIENYADGVVFQSAWSKAMYEQLGLHSKVPFAVIRNGAPEMFLKNSNKRAGNDKLKILASSWSANCNKGFEVLRVLGLEFGGRTSYDLVYIGNSPISLNGWRTIGPMDKENLAEELSSADVFIAPSRYDSCSNSLIEAIASGCTPYAKNHGGHPEIVGDGKLLFDDVDELIEKIVSLDFGTGSTLKPSEFALSSTVDRYIKFANSIAKNQAVDKNMAKPELARRRAMEIYYQNSVDPILDFAHHSIQLGVRKFLNSSHSKPQVRTGLSTDNFFESLPNILSEFLVDMKRCGESSYKLTQNGDLSEKTVFPTVFALKISNMTGLDFHTDSQRFIEGTITEKGAVDEGLHTLRRLGEDALNATLVGKNFSTIKRERTLSLTRQTISALMESSIKINSNTQNVIQNLSLPIPNPSDLDWSRPWSSAAQISHSIFMLSATNKAGSNDSLMEELEAETLERFGPDNLNQDSSVEENVYGLMKLATGFRWLPKDSFDFKVSEAIDLCLHHAATSHACNHLNVITALRWLTEIDGDYRREDVRSYAKSRVHPILNHWWPGFGGFSFYQRTSQYNYLGVKVSRGWAGPDLHGTALFVWALSEIGSILGDSSPLRPSRA